MTFKPLLASREKPDLKTLPYPLFWSPKLDGWRCMVMPYGTGVSPLTRKLKPLMNEKIRATLSRPELLNLDGELLSGPVTHPDVYNSSQRIASKGEGPGMRETVWLYNDAKGKPKMSFTPVEGGRQVDETNFYVFDDFTDPDLPFEQRFAAAKARVEALPADLKPLVKIVPHALVHNDIELTNIENVVVDKGYEGLMLRRRDGRYKFGRATLKELILAKMKRWEDTDAIVTGVIELMRNDNEATVDELGHTKRSTHAENMRPGGTMGALQVRYPEFGDAEGTCGGGFDDATRQAIWDARGTEDDWVGKTVVLKFQPSGTQEVPRFPIFKGVRDD